MASGEQSWGTYIVQGTQELGKGGEESTELGRKVWCTRNVQMSMEKTYVKRTFELSCSDLLLLETGQNVKKRAIKWLDSLYIY